MTEETTFKPFPSLDGEQAEEPSNFHKESNNSVQRQKIDSFSQASDRDQSPGSSIIDINEAHPDLGDEYGLAAAVERSIETPVDTEVPTTSASSSYEHIPELEDDKAFENPPESPSLSEGIAHRRSFPFLNEKASEADRIIDVKAHYMHRFSLYETSSRYYLVGADLDDNNFRVLKIDRTSAPGQLSIVEDEVIYSKLQMSRLLNAVEDGNKSSGGMKLRCNAWGLLGFIRFTEAYYMLLITKKQQVAMIGGHFVYQVDGTELIPLTTGPASKHQANRNTEEQRFLGILNNLDLHRSFYFSYSYNITRTLQHNTIRDRTFSPDDGMESCKRDFNDMFVWNQHLLGPALQNFKNPYHWCLPVIHGFIDQSCVDLFGRSIYVTLIARRSRFFAGARFLKRGVNDLGYVANDVETEQIVTEMNITSFQPPDHRVATNASCTSFVQHRGSIPLYWTQDNTGVSPKPGIDLNFIDPFYSAAALHFDDLFKRYGAPIAVLNLVRARERTPRESKLLVEYQNAVAYLNQALPADKKILYRAFDMARAAKTRGQDVIGSLETIAQEVVRTTGFFHNGVGSPGRISVQNGVTRSNCIDCLDRTNACQFVIGKTAFGLQLQALGLIAGDSVDYDSDASNILAHMYNDHGDTLASQYGGSHLVNTTDSYRKISNWQSHSRDMLESFKRYYHNSFRDSQRQDAYNLFLGNYRYSSGQPMLWDLPNDYYLHHTAPSSYASTKRRNYIKWFTPEYLEKRTMPAGKTVRRGSQSETEKPQNDWWEEYYRPKYLTTFTKTFSYRMNSTNKYLPGPKSSPSLDRSPFVVRGQPHDLASSEKTAPGQHVGFTDVNSREAINPLSATRPPQIPTKRISSVQNWLHGTDKHANITGPESNSRPDHLVHNSSAPPKQRTSNETTSIPAGALTKNQWSLQQFHHRSLHPTVTEDETLEYDRYISHPLKLPLVISDRPSIDTTVLDFQEYLDTTNHVGNAPPESGTLEGTMEYERWLASVPEDPLCVEQEDLEKKRYQAYRKWLKGKSLFKQSKVDPEFQSDI